MELTNIYKEFGKYPLKPVIEGCPCCDVSSSEKGLHKKDLHSLGWDDLSIFTFKAMTTFGDVSDFKHFLPRIFELYCTSFYDAHHDVGILFSKLQYADWLSWPESERVVVAETIRGWLDELRSDESDLSNEIYEEIISDMKRYGFDYSV